MRGRDGLDDRKTNTQAVVHAGPLVRQALEWLEQSADRVRRDNWPGVEHFQQGCCFSAFLDGNLNFSIGDVVPKCVLNKGWAIVIPALAWAGGIGVALLIGAAAGLLPALRASRMSPTAALWTL
jgi:hypothetical protein